jgi:thiosulfate dehydrogenase
MTKKFFTLSLTLSAIFVVIIVFDCCKDKEEHVKTAVKSSPVPEVLWAAPDSSRIPHSKEGDLIRYGRLLIANTSDYFGPHGTISRGANGMNCQNCHLDAGTKPWGNNYGGVFSTYPKFRERRGAVETVVQRVNDCFQRSLNGTALDSNSYEMQAILAYMKWLGANIAKGKKPPGSGIQQPVFLNRAADPQKGELVYVSKCQRCHGPDGQGMLRPPDSTKYLYPPLWGVHSYNTGAGLYRLSRFAGYVRDNMPFGASYHSAQLTDEESWDVAAFVNSKPRPTKVFKKDWPDISLKPFDHPFGPYTDSFSEQQHKYGPFGPIQKAKQMMAKKKTG